MIPSNRIFARFLEPTPQQAATLSKQEGEEYIQKFGRCRQRLNFRSLTLHLPASGRVAACCGVGSGGLV